MNRNRTYFLIGGFTLVAVAIVAARLPWSGPKPAPAPPPPAAGNCEDLSAASVGRPRFQQGIFTFREAPGAAFKWMINIQNGRRGLQFADQGGRIDAQSASKLSEFEIETATFGRPVNWVAMDANGQRVAQVTVNSKIWQRYTLSGPNLRSLAFEGGSNEGVLLSICAR